MKLFVTGAGGFIGQALIEQLAQENCEALCLVRRPLELWPGGAAHLRQVCGDFGDPGGWLDELRSFAADVSIHLAWEGLPDYSPQRCAHNVAASLRCAEAIAQSGCRRLIVAGSCFEYGAAQGAINEVAAPVNPGELGQAKDRLRRALEAQLPQVRLVWSRIFYAYGARQRPQSLIPYCVRTLTAGAPLTLKTPQQMQDFIYLADLARALYALAQAEHTQGVYNIGSGVATRCSAVANLVAHTLGVPPPFAHSLRPDVGFYADVARIRRETGWQATTDLAQGVRRTVKEIQTEALT